MNTELKIQYFDYFVTSLIKNCYNISNTDNTSDIIAKSIVKSGLSKLKLMKLLFFVTTVEAEKWFLLDNVFDNFYAMPYGPVESDVYNNLSSLRNYTISGNNLYVKKGAEFTYRLDQTIKGTIDSSIDKLKLINPAIFTMGAFELVELSHKADSWRIIFSQAQSIGNLSRHIPNDVIKMSKVYFK